jgi:Zn-dependent M28 family amino/carboxypeptidase
VDNASGVASMLEVARGLANGPSSPRTLLFVATTAEEYGLLGARVLARHPPAKLVAGLNLDTVAIAPRGKPIAVIGRGLTPLDPLIDDTARALGRKVDTGTDANAYVTRQDGWALMSAGVPAVMAGGAFNDRALLERFFASRYHGPADDLAHDIEFGGAAEDVTFHVALARRLADPSLFPASVR